MVPAPSGATSSPRSCLTLCVLSPERPSSPNLLEDNLPDPAYHTDSPEYSHREVHHNNNDCPNGKQIKPEHRKAGDGGKPLCKNC